MIYDVHVFVAFCRTWLSVLISRHPTLSNIIQQNIKSNALSRELHTYMMSTYLWPCVVRDCRFLHVDIQLYPTVLDNFISRHPWYQERHSLHGCLLQNNRRVGSLLTTTTYNKSISKAALSWWISTYNNHRVGSLLITTYNKLISKAALSTCMSAHNNRRVGSLLITYRNNCHNK